MTSSFLILEERNPETNPESFLRISIIFNYLYSFHAFIEISSISSLQMA